VDNPLPAGQISKIHKKSKNLSQSTQSNVKLQVKENLISKNFRRGASPDFRK
jgi:hypothetical protein